MSEIDLTGESPKEATFNDFRDCPTLTIGLSDADPAHVWTIKVWARMPDGSMYVGAFETTPPPSQPSRIIGTACVPGALNWTVRASRPTTRGGPFTAATGRIQITRHEAFGPVGLIPNGNFATVSPAP